MTDADLGGTRAGGDDPSVATTPVNEQLRRHRPDDLLRLTSLRAFAALLVFGFHLADHGLVGGNTFLDVGDAGVAFFFVLSGFVLAWSTSPSMRGVEFFRRRFARIYPSHLVVLVVAALLPVVAVGRSAASAVANLFLLQAWDPSTRIAYGMNGVAWSLSCEMAFYAAFPLTLLLLLRLPARWRWTVAAGWVGLEVLAGILAVARHDAGLQGDLYVFPLARFGEFLLGMVAALELRAGRAPRPAWCLAAVATGAVLTAALPLTRPLDTDYLILAFFGVILLAAHRDRQGTRGLLTSRPFVYAGQVSFAFYLVHELVIVNLRREAGAGWGVAVAALAVAVAAAVALHHLVELPCQRWLRRVPLPGARVRGHSGDRVAAGIPVR